MKKEQTEITGNKNEKKRKKKVSSLVAASLYRSPVAHANRTSTSSDFGHSGTNITYHEDGGIA